MKTNSLTDKLCEAKSLVQEVMDVYPQEAYGSGLLEVAIERIGRAEIEIESIEDSDV